MNEEISTKSAETYRAEIFIAGNRQVAVEACREYCLKGLCVTVTDCDFVYTGGMETGVSIGLINYPRFPSGKTDILSEAVSLGDFLIHKLHQSSCSIVADDKTIWLTRRDEK